MLNGQRFDTIFLEVSASLFFLAPLRVQIYNGDAQLFVTKGNITAAAVTRESG